MRVYVLINGKEYKFNGIVECRKYCQNINKLNYDSLIECIETAIGKIDKLMLDNKRII